MKKLLAVGILALFLTGCGDLTLDASTQETLQTSMAKIQQSLPDAKRTEFTSAMSTIVEQQISAAFVMGSNRPSNLELEDRFRKLIHGKTADEVIKEAAAMKAEEAKAKANMDSIQ
ncbi:hypothetical protein EDF82_1438 [Raoultella sp. BIGb0399]|uniref:DUF6694 family lipoprotein n=1 Tax=Raoultella lignicola TaxID=3040939 RepID=A0ABU9F317_9ENTR|nr:DUF6694 family lipoprotein [Raoultella sp. BIGb0399]ROS16309.1 hypothetical protein EDF82_1438 [Raoultella sp. BIGb0399]